MAIGKVPIREVPIKEVPVREVVTGEVVITGQMSFRIEIKGQWDNLHGWWALLGPHPRCFF